MADQEKPRRRRTWLVPLVAIGAGVWFFRSRRTADPDAWLPPLPAPMGDPAPEHVATAPAAATLDPEPAAASTENGAAAEPEPAAAVSPGSADPAPQTEPPAVPPPVSTPPAAGSAPAAEAANPLFTEASPAPEKGTAALADGSAPGPEFVIKGNAGSMLFHTETSPYYGRTKAEVWFRTEEEATAAGFTKWTRRRPSS